jgi:hypothetical protein
MPQHREGPDALWLAAGLAWLIFQLIVHAVALVGAALSYRRPWGSSGPTQGRSPSRPTSATTTTPAERPLHQPAEQLDSQAPEPGAGW